MRTRVVPHVRFNNSHSSGRRAAALSILRGPFYAEIPLAALAVKLLKEPLLHFLLAGGVLFAVHAWMNPATNEAAVSASHTVRITGNEVAWLKQTWTRQWQRSPSEAELKGLVAGYLREVLLAQEARALGLDENDTVVRRRLAQKMEFMVQDTAQLAEPGEEQLQRFFETHREYFQSPARVSFTHVYFNRDRRGVRTEADARAALQQLSQTGAAVSASDLGDRFLGGYDFVEVDESEVASVLGPELAHRIFSLAPSKWQGPLASGYGLHLIRIGQIRLAQPRELGAVETEVRKLWREQREQEVREQYFAALLERYDVVVDESIRPLVGPPKVSQEHTR